MKYKPWCTGMKNVPCGEFGYYIVFDGYDSSDMDSVFLYTYTPDNTFTTEIDSRIFTGIDSVYDVFRQVYYKNSYNISIAKGFDYKLILTKTKQTFYIYNVISNPSIDTVDCARKMYSCFSAKTFSLSGGKYHTGGGGFAYSFIFLEK